MFQKKKGIIVLFMLVLVVSLTVSGDSDKRWVKGPTVDEIYENIRQSGMKYEYDQQIVTFENEGMNMVCTFVVPKTPEKPPIIITMNGFAEDRHYKIVPDTGGEWFYERLSRILAEQGFATLRIDYRGSGDSDGDFTMTTFSTQVSDALAAVDYVRKLRRRVNWSSIGLVGFSQGGLVASIAASMDERVDSLVIWSAVASPPITYASLLSSDGIQQGLALPDGGTITLGIYAGDFYYGDIELGKAFFYDLFAIDPIAHIKDYKGPLMYIAGIRDIIVWPQPRAGQTFMDYHDGFEKLVVLDGDHEFDSDYGYETYDQTLYWTAAWFIKTLE